jgi:hypothetical protein
MFLLSRVNNSIQQLIIYKMYQNVIPRSLRRLLDMQVLQANKEWQRSCLWNFGKVRKPWQTRPYPFEAGARKPPEQFGVQGSKHMPSANITFAGHYRKRCDSDVLICFELWILPKLCKKTRLCWFLFMQPQQIYIYIYYTILINILVWAM